MTDKECNRCRVTKPLSMFYRCHGGKGGRMTQCAECISALRKQKDAEIRERQGPKEHESTHMQLLHDLQRNIKLLKACSVVVLDRFRHTMAIENMEENVRLLMVKNVKKKQQTEVDE